MMSGFQTPKKNVYEVELTEVYKYIFEGIEANSEAEAIAEAREIDNEYASSDWQENATYKVIRCKPNKRFNII